MDLTFSDEQRMLADGVSRFLEQERAFHARQAQLAEGVTLARNVWSHLAKQGLLALPRSEAVGGMGGTIADVVAIAMRFGGALLTEPYFATVILAGAALEAAGTDEAQALLARIASGDAIAAFAHDEAVSGGPAKLIETNAIANDNGYV
ncbi:MAG: acyl-CoA dehydrogenase family protein, partial [Mycobacteriales bacterium]